MILYIGFLIFVLFIPFSWVWCCTSQLPFATIAAPSQWQIKKRGKKKPPIFWAKLCCVWLSVLLPLRSNPLGRAPAPPAPSPSPDPVPWDKGQRWAGIPSPWQSQHSREGGGGTRRPVDQGMESSMSGKRNQRASVRALAPSRRPPGGQGSGCNQPREPAGCTGRAGSGPAPCSRASPQHEAGALGQLNPPARPGKAGILMYLFSSGSNEQPRFPSAESVMVLKAFY